LTINDADLRWIEQEIENPLISMPPILTVNTDPIDEEEMIYKHWLYWVDRESPSELIDRFRQLFIVGANYPDREVEAALYRICITIDCKFTFQNILSRCCRILIHHWVPQRKRYEIDRLIDLFDERNSASETIASLSPIARRLQQLRHFFIQSEEFKRLKRLAALYGENKDRSSSVKKPLIQLIRRYPYLDPKPLSLISENSSIEEQNRLRKLLEKRRRKFEVDLLRYAEDLLNDKISVILQPNPTLLREDQLAQALTEFMGKVEGSSTYKESSHRFLSQLKARPSSYKEFKSQLYEYLISNINPQYGHYHFYKKLDRQLSEMFPESNDRPLSKILVMQTCYQLCELLIANPKNEKSYYVFFDLISNIGITKTLGLLLKIALLSHGINPHFNTPLEQRFSILFKHHENDDIKDQDWLVRSLENLNVALATNFSKIDISVFKDSL
jgi:hypothetical protein